MEKEQAIEKLNDIRCHVKETSAEEQALVMAIEALKQPEIVRCGECELKLVCCRTIRSEGRRDDDFCSCGIREERRTDD